jgi:hypothetical protein
MYHVLTLHLGYLFQLVTPLTLSGVGASAAARKKKRGDPIPGESSSGQ